MRMLFVTTLLLAACGDDALDLATPDNCNPLGGSRCIAPWPSSVYEVEDPTTETGRRLAIPVNTLPTNIDNIAFDPARYNRYDGFSSAAPMITAFETGIDGSNLIYHPNYDASITAASPTILIDMSTGELVPHFAELDARATDTPASQALFLRSAKMLKGSTRYVAAIKKTLKAKGGGELPISEGFQALLDGEKTTHPLLEKVRPRYTEIFAALEANGIAKTDLVVAWDFTTQSRATVRADLLDARTVTLAMVGTDGAALNFTATDTVQDDPRFARRIDGTFDAPLFLSNQTATTTTKLLRDADGKPMASGLYRAPFTAIIPQCAITANAPVPIMIYGHGLLRDGTLTADLGPRSITHELCVIAIGTDMRGMSTQDVPNVVTGLNDGNQGPLIFDALIQGMMNHIALVQIARGPMAQRLFLDGTRPLADPSKVYFYGLSQGGIMGTTVCAIDPVIKRCVVQVGAINYSLLLERSRDWPRYRTTLIGAYPDAMDVAIMLNVIQQEWDRTEPTSVADVITGQGFPNTPPKQIFMQMGVADDQVSNLASEYQLRTMDIPVVTPSPYIPWGATSTAAPAASGMVIYDYGLGSTIPNRNEAPPDNDVHLNVRSHKATTDMMKRFYDTGEIVQMCTAPKGCDCTIAGACGPAI